MSIEEISRKVPKFLSDSRSQNLWYSIRLTLDDTSNGTGSARAADHYKLYIVSLISICCAPPNHNPICIRHRPAPPSPSASNPIVSAARFCWGIFWIRRNNRPIWKYRQTQLWPRLLWRWPCFIYKATTEGLLVRCIGFIYLSPYWFNSRSFVGDSWSTSLNFI